MNASDRAQREAKILMDQPTMQRLLSPYRSVADDGEINLLWIRPSIRLDLGLYGDGTYAYYGRAANGMEFYGDDIPIMLPLLQEIRDLLQQ